MEVTSPNCWKHEIRRPRDQLLIADALVYEVFVRGKEVRLLDYIFVHHKFRKRRFGTKLLRFITENYSSHPILLRVQPYTSVDAGDNRVLPSDILRRFYRSHGFLDDRKFLSTYRASAKAGWMVRPPDE